MKHVQGAGFGRKWCGLDEPPLAAITECPSDRSQLLVTSCPEVSACIYSGKKWEKAGVDRVLNMDWVKSNSCGTSCIRTVAGTDVPVADHPRASYPSLPHAAPDSWQPGGWRWGISYGFSHSRWMQEIWGHTAQKNSPLCHLFVFSCSKRRGGYSSLGSVQSTAVPHGTPEPEEWNIPLASSGPPMFPGRFPCMGTDFLMSWSGEMQILGALLADLPEWVKADLGPQQPKAAEIQHPGLYFSPDHLMRQSVPLHPKSSPNQYCFSLFMFLSPTFFLVVPNSSDFPFASPSLLWSYIPGKASSSWKTPLLWVRL